MDARSTFIPLIQAAKLMEPRQRALDDPAGPAEAASMLGAALRQLRLDVAAVEGVPVRLRIIAAVACTRSGFRRGRPGRPHRGSIASTSGKSWVMSFRFAAVSRAASGIPCASVRR